MKNKSLVADGQLSIFDIQITEKPKKITKIDEKVTEKAVCVTETINKVTTKEIEKTVNPLEPTEKQKQFLNKNKFLENGILSRIIIHPKNSITVETKKEDVYTSHYVNMEGKEEFSFNKKSPVLPWEKIFYYSSEFKNLKFSRVQIDKLHKFLNSNRNEIKRVVHRKGDENILIEAAGKIIDILPNGWLLEFESLDHIECAEDEVYLIPAKNEEEKTENLKELQQQVKVGDYVQAKNGKRIIEGEIVRVYGGWNESLNICFENGTKETAIARISVTKIIKGGVDA